MTKRIRPEKIMRMSNDTRWTMRNNAVDIKFKKREEKFNAELTTMAYEIHKAVYTPDILNIMLELPSDAFGWSQQVEVSGLPNAKELGFKISYLPNLNSYAFTLTSRHYLPKFCKSIINLEDLPKSLQNKVRHLHKKGIILAFEKATYLSKVKDFLSSCKSCKKMLELLPESYNWLPDKEGCSDTDIADKAAAIANL